MLWYSLGSASVRLLVFTLVTVQHFMGKTSYSGLNLLANFVYVALLQALPRYWWFRIACRLPFMLSGV